MNNTQYLLALHSIDGLGPVRLKAILDYFGDPKIAWEAQSKEKRKNLDPQKYMEHIQNSGINWITLFDKTYPYLLSQIYDPPIVLYYKGKLDCLNEKCIAVVGTRKMTDHGKAVCEQFTRGFVNFDLTIVSGLARGIDTQAHKTAIEANGQTAAVLGSGLNEIYPPENRELASRIINGHGCLISEFRPDYPSLPGNFPIRNRIISGLSLATLVVEAAKNSGSQITAKSALEQGREVFVIAPNDLIKDGAFVVYEPEEILDELGL